MASRGWIVHGTTGEYSDRKVWAIAVYRRAVSAQEHVENATAVAHAHKVGYSETAGWEERDAFVEKMRVSIELRALMVGKLEIEDYFTIDYNGMRFWLEEVEIREAAPSWEG